MNIDYPVKFIYSTGKNIDYDDFVIIFNAISITSLLGFIHTVIEKKTYVEEYKSVFFGPLDEDGTSKKVGSNEVLVFYVDTEFIVKQETFYQFCLSFITRVLEVSVEHNFAKRNIVNNKWINELRESKEHLLCEVRCLDIS